MYFFMTVSFHAAPHNRPTSKIYTNLVFVFKYLKTFISFDTVVIPDRREGKRTS
jgi:hypothetical protein